MTQTAIILAGGFGTRLQAVVSDLPKPMAPINGEPFLNYQLRYLKHYGIKNVVLSVGYLHEKVEAFYKNKFEDITITYVVEKTALGTGGGIRLAMEHCKEECVLALNGDSFFDMNLNAFYAQHSSQHSHTSLALRKITNASRYGTIETDSTNRITRFREKSGTETAGTINAGVYLLSKSVYFENTQAGVNFSIERDFFETKAASLGIKGFEFEGYFIDIGVPEDYTKAQHDFEEFKYR